MEFWQVIYKIVCQNPRKKVSLCIFKDVNEDGNVDASDATTLINNILGLLNLDDTACEINADGTVDVSDVTSLIALILNQ